MRTSIVALALLLPAAACATPSHAPAPAAPAIRPTPPNWKERLEQPYLYVDHRGDYRRLDRSLRSLLEAALAAHVEPTGPPFALFYDDPSRVPLVELRSRACLPVAPRQNEVPGLSRDVLPQALVAYARVAGDYRDAPRSYPALFRFLDEHGWVPAGPVREVYLVDPASVAGTGELVTEIQVPWRPKPRAAAPQASAFRSSASSGG